MTTLGSVSPAAAPSLMGRSLSQRRSSQAFRTIRGATTLAILEASVALAIFGSVIVVQNWDLLPTGLQSALSMRVTLRNLLLLAILASGWTLIFRMWGLYRTSLVQAPRDEILAAIGACLCGTLLAGGLATLSAPGGFGVAETAYFGIGATAGTLALRRLRRLVTSRSLGQQRRRVLIVGCGARALRTWRRMVTDRPTSYTLAGFVDAPDSTPVDEFVGRHWLGSTDTLESMLMHHDIDEVRIALPLKSRYLESQQALLVCERVGVQASYAADVFDTEFAWARYHGDDSPTVTMHVVADDYRLTIKRLIDVSGAAAALLLLSPLMLSVALAIASTSPGPVVFAQERYGLNRRRFRMFKFRTMVPDAERLQASLEAANEADGPVFKMASDPRITPIGRLLRRTSLDELPQLFNVLRGEMSLVGPRPLPLRDVDRFTRAADMRRFSVRPGLTCLWQISGRSTLSFSDWIALDLAYIDAWSLALDCLILIRTVPAVVRGTGAR